MKVFTLLTVIVSSVVCNRPPVGMRMPLTVNEQGRYVVRVTVPYAEGPITNMTLTVSSRSLLSLPPPDSGPAFILLTDSRDDSSVYRLNDRSFNGIASRLAALSDPSILAIGSRSALPQSAGSCTPCIGSIV